MGDQSWRWVAALAAGGLLMGLSVAQATEPASSDRPSVHEVTMAAPDIIAVEIRDPAFVQNGIVPLPGGKQPANRGHWVDLGGQWAKIVGPEGAFARISDRPPPAYLDRAAIDDASAYGKIGGRTVTNVYRKSVPYDSGIFPGPNAEDRTGASLKHYVYLKLDGKLPDGAYTISFPRDAAAPASFSFSDRSTRAIAIHANQNGYAPGDESKIAFLSLWLPGGPAEGAVDFRNYGLKQFEIVDEAGKKAFSGDLVLRKGPADPEPGNGLPGPVIEYPSASGKPVTVTQFKPGKPVRLVLSGGAFKPGQRIWIKGFEGQYWPVNSFHTVTAVDGDEVTLADVDGTEMPPLKGEIGQAFTVNRANRAGTYVFQIDFGAWKPAAEGQYRIRIPGLGVSDPFPVTRNVWAKAAQVAAAGLYNQRSGVALDGRYGLKRPAPFRPGESIEQFRSRLPFAFSGESTTGFIGFKDAGKAPWITKEKTPPDYWGGYMDAGDWDRRIHHVDVSYLLLDLYETLGPTKNVSLGIPKSSEALDPALYAGTDSLPDLLQEAIWNLDMFRRMQQPDGSVIGALESSGDPLPGEPSYLSGDPAFAYAPDHVSTYRYAAGAAKLATLLDPLAPKLAAVFADSAKRAWTAAEGARADPDAYYAEAIKIAEDNKLFQEGGWDAFKQTLAKAAERERMGAAGALFRLTGDAAFRDAFEQMWNKGFEFDGHPADGAWEYYRSTSPLADTKRKAEIRAAILKAATFFYNGSAQQAYDNLKHFYAPLGWGQGLPPDYNAVTTLIRAHQLASNPAILKAMENGSGQLLGANQVGLSFTTGLGLRNIRHPLHEDHRAMGVPAPPGITVFGWAPQWQTSNFWIFGPPWSPLPVSGTDENAAQRSVSPERFTMPVFEYLIEQPQLVMQQEYTVQQSTATTLAMWLYLADHVR